jgi:HSP20 family protein
MWNRFDSPAWATNTSWSGWPTLSGSLPHWPGMDARDTPEARVYSLAVPGYRKRDITVQIDGRQLVVSGQRRPGWFGGDAWRSFVQSFTLPEMLDDQAVRADLRDGVLCIAVAKKPEARARRIPVRVAGRTPPAPGLPPEDSWWTRLKRKLRAHD